MIATEVAVPAKAGAMRLKLLRIVGYVEPVIVRFILMFNVILDNRVCHCP
jgi:hypothetical protein